MGKLNSAKMASLIALRAQGKSYRQIADHLKINKNTVMAHVLENQTEIRYERAFIIDEVLKEYNISFMEDVGFNVATLRKIRERLDKIDLSEISFRDLITFERTRIQNINELVGHKPVITEKHATFDVTMGNGVREETTIRYQDSKI